MTAEEERTRLIGDIARVLRDGPVPDEARSAALTFIGWLARRMPGEPVSMCDIGRCTGTSKSAARDSQSTLRTAREQSATATPSYAGPPSGPSFRDQYADGSGYEASNDRPRSAR